MPVPILDIFAEKAEYVEVLIKDLGLDDNGCTQGNFWEDQDRVQSLNQYVAEHHPEIKYGDLVRIVEEYDKGAYRNTGLFVHDGSALKDLTGKWDDYGSLPQSVQVTDTEFHPLYWFPARDWEKYQAYAGVAHNNIIFPSAEIRRRAAENITWEDETWVSRFEVRGIKWILAFETVDDEKYKYIPLDGITDEMWAHIHEMKEKRLELFKMQIMDETYAFDNIALVVDNYSNELYEKLTNEAQTVHKDFYPFCLRKRWI